MNNATHTLLRDLVELLIDSELGYAEATSRATDERIQQLFKKFSASRGQAIIDISRELMRDGEEVPEGGTLKGTLHRAWMDIRNALTSTHNAAMLDECERGEHYLVGRYEDAIKSEQVPPHIQEELAAQLALVRCNVIEVEKLNRLFDKVDS
ncbi:MAG: PA2169 family four-helix-bundle protein [Flavobacteriales bacterium]